MNRTAPQSLALLILFAVGLLGCGPGEHTTVLRMAHTLDTSHTVHKAMVHMGERLAHYSGGAMRLELYPGGQLGNERELIELLQIGSLAMTKVSAAPLEGFVPEMKLFNIPYVFRSKDHYWRVLESGIGQELLDAPRSVRLKGLGYYDAGSRSFYTVKKAVHQPADLAGLKIRVQESQTAVRMVSALGGAATPIAWGELYTALQQGVVDGAENNPPSFYLSGHYEICKYYTLDEHTYVPDLLLIGTPTWEGLSPEQQTWLRQAVDDSVVFQRRLWDEDSSAALAAVEAAGVQIIRPDKSRFQSSVREMQASYEGTAVGELIKRIAELGG